MPVNMKQIESQMNEHGFKYYLDPEQQTMIVPVPADGDLLNITVTLAEEGEYIQCQIPCFVNAKKAVDREALLVEMLHLNYKLKMVKLGFDPTDDEINVEIGLPVEDGALTDRQLSRMFGVMFHMMNDCRPALIELINTGKSSKEMEDDVVRQLLDDCEEPADSTNGCDS